jgi:hypothetical protein
MLATNTAGQPEQYRMLNWGAGLTLRYLYLRLTHLAGGQNCVTWALSLGLWAGHLCMRDCAENVGTPAQLTIGKPGPVGHGMEMTCVQENLVSLQNHKTLHHKNSIEQLKNQDTCKISYLGRSHYSIRALEMIFMTRETQKNKQPLWVISTLA